MFLAIATRPSVQKVRETPIHASIPCAPVPENVLHRVVHCEGYGRMHTFVRRLEEPLLHTNGHSMGTGGGRSKTDPAKLDTSFFQETIR